MHCQNVQVVFNFMETVHTRSKSRAKLRLLQYSDRGVDNDAEPLGFTTKALHSLLHIVKLVQTSLIEIEGNDLPQPRTSALSECFI